MTEKALRTAAREMQVACGKSAIMYRVLAEAAETIDEALRYKAISDQKRQEAREWGEVARGMRRPSATWFKHNKNEDGENDDA